MRSELMINFNVTALDKMDESNWVEPALAFDEDETQRECDEVLPEPERNVTTLGNVFNYNFCSPPLR